jgi:hypothetical protein
MSERLSHAEMAYELARQIASKASWLADFSNGPRKRPQHEINSKQEELRVLEQARDDYRRAADRVSGSAATGDGYQANTPVAASASRRFGERQTLHSRQ